VAGDNAQIINVLELPPNAFDKILVNDESLNGTCIYYVPLPFFNSLSAKASIHRPNIVNDKFILLAI